jgi:hypothetical protein
MLSFPVAPATESVAASARDYGERKHERGHNSIYFQNKTIRNPATNYIVTKTVRFRVVVVFLGAGLCGLWRRQKGCLVLLYQSFGRLI